MNVLYFQKAQKFLIGAFLFLTSIALFVPLNPILPMEGLDPSWMFTLNEAVSRKWVFGKDIIFTFGPYASIYSQAYHPNVDHLTLWSSLFLSICYASLVFLFLKKTKAKWILAYSLFIAGFINFPEILLTSYPFILGLFIYRFTLPQDHLDHIELGNRLRKISPVFFAPLGLLVLIKGSFLPLCFLTIALSFMFFWQKKQRKLAFFILLSALLSFFIFWTISGQTFFAIFFYFINITRIASNYTEAMALPADPYHVLSYIIATFLILSCTLTQKTERPANKYFVAFFIFSYLFIIFKSRFVRHNGHSEATFPFLILVSIFLLTLDLKKWILIIASLFCIISWSYIDTNNFNSHFKKTFQIIIHQYSNFYKGAKLRISSQNKLKKKYEHRLSKIRESHPINKLEGSTDIYSHHQSYLLSSDNTFSLRPIFQSYSAYSPKLLELNEMFLRSEKAPENILFRIEPIDYRFPPLEDGLSWPTIIQNYSIDSFENEFIYLKKKKQIKTTFTEHAVYLNKIKLNKDVKLPLINEGLFAEIDISPRFHGKILSFLFKSPELLLTITMEDETKKTYRFVSTMGKTKFLISPLVENTKDFFLFAQNNNNKYVKKIRVRGNSSFWNSTYTLKLYKIEYVNDPL